MFDGCEVGVECEGDTHKEMEMGSLIEIQCLVYIVKLQLELLQFWFLFLRHGDRAHERLRILPAWS